MGEVTRAAVPKSLEDPSKNFQIRETIFAPLGSVTGAKNFVDGMQVSPQRKALSKSVMYVQ
jgi:hypothetical protein